MFRTLTALLALLVLVTIASANYTLGSDGYYYQNGVAHTRAWVAGSSYYSGGCYYTSPGYYSYTPVVVPTVNVTINPPPYSPNWKNEVIKFLEGREDRLAYENMLKAIGYSASGVLNTGSYGAYGSYGFSTSTQYGIQQPPLVTNAFSFNVDQALLDSHQLGQASNASNERLIGGLQGVVNGFGNRAADIAYLNALREFLRPQPVTTTTSGTFRFDGNKLIRDNTERLPDPKEAGLASRLHATQSNRCAKCHAGADVKGNFDLAKFHLLPAAEAEKVIDRIELPLSDPKHMPPGVDLTHEEKAAWYQALREIRRAATQPALKPEVPKLNK